LIRRVIYMTRFFCEDGLYNGACRTGYGLFVILACDQADRDQFHTPMLARNFLRLGKFEIESVSEMPRRQLLTHVVLKMKRKGVSVMTKTLVHVTDHLPVRGVEIYRNVDDRVASAIEVAQHVSA